MTRITADELYRAIQEGRVDAIAPKEPKGQAGKGNSAAGKSAAKSQGSTRTRRPFHTYPLIGLVAIFAYILLAIGWFIGAVGDSIYEVGQRMQSVKWNIK